MSVYDFEYVSIEGKPVKLSEYGGKVLLIVNTASKCGFTKQYKGFEELYERYRERGFVVIGFPCNQFGGQEPGDESQIAEFCSVRFGVTFPLSKKVKVNGPDAEPLYKYLKEQKGLAGTGEDANPTLELAVANAKTGGARIKWNFTKFLIDRKGNVVSRHEPKVEPENLAGDVERLL